jgi:threonine/homoserine efflux transporter RhtA
MVMRRKHNRVRVGISAAAGYLVLHQTLTAAGALAITLVIVASAGAVRTSSPPRG